MLNVFSLTFSLSQAIFPIGLTQQDGGWRVTVRDTLDVHGHECILKLSSCLNFVFCYMGTNAHFVCQDHQSPETYLSESYWRPGFRQPVISAATLKDIGTAAAEGVVSSIASDNIVVGIANQGIVVTSASDVLDVAQATRVCRFLMAAKSVVVKSKVSVPLSLSPPIAIA